MNTVAILKTARAVIQDENDWGQGDDRCGACALDALRVEENMTDDDPCVRLATTFLKRSLPDDFEADHSDWNHPVAQFNDRPETTHGDVIALYDRAIATAESGAA